MTLAAEGWQRFSEMDRLWHEHPEDAAQRLGIAQQSASEHLYGKMRNGRAGGGAIRKLRKACARHGLSFNG